MWEISKEFGFEFGHRVWKQKLNPSFSLDSTCACRYLHGHFGRVVVSLFGDKLDDQNMITDYKHLNWFKKFLDTYLDHKFLFDKEDPILEFILGDLWRDQSTYLFHNEGFWLVLSRLDMSLCRKELFGGIVLLPFVPTSERLSVWFYNIVSTKMKEIGVEVSSVQFCETVKSQCKYYPDRPSLG
jgi:6-pyruvoyltetrahydropterin/6-carboxytetrahydropterin synthase